MDGQKCERLMDIFNQAGIYLVQEDYHEELQMDSLQFITLIVGVENVFSIEIDEKNYTDGTLRTFHDFLNLII